MDGRIVENDPRLIHRTAHETLILNKHEDGFFAGLHTLVEGLGKAFPTTFDGAHTQVFLKSGRVVVSLLFDTNGSSLAGHVRVAGDIERLLTLYQQDTHA